MVWEVSLNIGTQDPLGQICISGKLAGVPVAFSPDFSPFSVPKPTILWCPLSGAPTNLTV